jgi:Ser/Thr protein kinase RdoA (MazF antagonist)
VLPAPVIRAETLSGGHGRNDNWTVATADGGRYVVKFAPASSESKSRSAHLAHLLAGEAGVPVAPVVHFGVHADRLMRVYGWIDGRTPTPESLVGHRAARLFSDLGAATALLHGINHDAFSSRLDGSSPAFGGWSDYVEYRLEHVRDRCRSVGAVDETELARAVAIIQDLAQAVSPVARPTLCHRDLYAGNVLVDREGRLAAVLDFDLAEIWDTAGEWFKLDWLFFPSYPGSASVFAEAYWAGRSVAPDWDSRVKLVGLLETLNTIPNAMAQHDSDFEAKARRRLHSLLG